MNLAWPMNSCSNSVCQTETLRGSNMFTVDENKDARLSNSVLSSCAIVLLCHKGVGTLPNLGRVPLGTVSRCAVLEAKGYTNFWRRAPPFVRIWRTTSLARLDDLELALSDNLGRLIVFSKSFLLFCFNFGLSLVIFSKMNPRFPTNP